MFPIKLLTWLCSFLLLSSCSHIIQRDVLNLFYVADIKEIHGMQLKHKLLHYFNKNPNDSLYIINIDTTLNRQIDLLNKYGFATQGNLTLSYKMTIINKSNGFILLTRSNNLRQSYSLSDSGYRERQNEQKAREQLVNQIVDNIVDDVYFFHSNLDKYLSISGSMCVISEL